MLINLFVVQEETLDSDPYAAEDMNEETSHHSHKDHKFVEIQIIWLGPDILILNQGPNFVNFLRWISGFHPLFSECTVIHLKRLNYECKLTFLIHTYHMSHCTSRKKSG